MKTENRELAKAIENYLVALKLHSIKPSSRKFKLLQEAERKLFILVSLENSLLDITLIFSDLRDYWDTLEAGK